MRAIISSTFDDSYLFFLPITSWCWKKLGVETTLILPDSKQATTDESRKAILVGKTLQRECGNGDNESIAFFKCPKNKEATYAQVSRLFAGALIFAKDEILITSDADMLVFRNVFADAGDFINILGADLVPPQQFPMCYAFGKAKSWRTAMKIGNKSLQDCLDEQLAHEECENMRGNLWARDQQLLYNYTMDYPLHFINRARPGTQFASNRIDRDDSFYYDRLNKDVIDAHLWRPGYTSENFNKILSLIQYFYPGESLAWLMDYRNAYVNLIK